MALGRAIVREPKAFLMDEPLGALDAEFREHMAEELRALHDRMGATTVYVTHDQLEAMQMGDKIVVMNHGVVEQWGTPQEILRPARQHVRGRLHRLAADEFPPLRGHLPARRRERAPVGGGGADPAGRRRAWRAGRWRSGCGRSTCGSVAGAAYRGEVVDAEYLGTTQIVTLRTGNGVVKARTPAGERVRAGETVGLAFDTATLSLFDAGSGRALPLDRAAARAAAAGRAANG